MATFVHEVIHALFFSPDLFKDFPANSNGDSFHWIITDPNNDQNKTYKVRGDTILQQIRTHFNCPSIDAGKILSSITRKRLLRMEEKVAQREVISKNWFLEMTLWYLMTQPTPN